MKRFFLFALGLLMWQLGQAQDASFGIKVGLSTNNLDIQKKENITAGDTTYSYGTGDTKVGFQAGFMGRIEFGGFILQPELYFSSTQNEFELSAQPSSDATPRTVTQSLNKLDIPILAGYKFGLNNLGFRINAGPVATLIMSEDNGFIKLLGRSAGEDVDGDANNFTFGLQGGVGVDIGKLTIDARYETNLSQLGDGITVGNQTYSYDTRQSQIMLSLGILF